MRSREKILATDEHRCTRIENKDVIRVNPCLSVANILSRLLREPVGQTEKPHRMVPKTFGTMPMRLAQGWAGVRRRAIWITTFVAPFLARSASYFSSPETPDNYRYLNPRREHLKPSGKKPLCSNQLGKTNEQNHCKHRLPQARCLRPLIPLPPACCSRGQVRKVNSPIQIIFSNWTTTCQCF